MPNHNKKHFYRENISSFLLCRYCKLCFLIGNDHLMNGQTKARPSLIDINHASAKAILNILNSKPPTCSKNFEVETLQQGIVDKTSTNSSIFDFLKSSSSIPFLFVALKEFEKNDFLSQKKALVSLSRSCVNYFKPNVFDMINMKPILQRAFLFGNFEDEEPQKRVNLVVNCFQKRFQNSLLDSVDVFQGWCQSFTSHSSYFV